MRAAWHDPAIGRILDSMPVWFGLHCPNYTFDAPAPERLFEQLLGQVHAAEEAGFGLVTVMDHLNQIPVIGPQDHPMLEAWSTLAALARETTRVRLGTLVTGVTYRNPALLAKTATTLDVISGGRAIFGIGAAWFEAEHVAFGYDFPSIRERMDRLDEALSIAHGMFEQQRSTFEGRYHRTSDVLNVPRPVQAGGPPILVGGAGEQRTLRIAAKHADMTHWFPIGLDGLAHKTDVLRGYCERIGRDPAEIERTLATPVLVGATEADARAIWETLSPERQAQARPMTVAQAADELRPYIDAGFTGFTFNNNVYRTPEQIAVVGELLRLVA
jgi:F420-dependent oxidoreductase-like protein